MTDISWIEITKAISGPFGATLAFAGNAFFQWRQRRDQDVAYGNTALINLENQARAFGAVSTGFRKVEEEKN